MKSTKNLWPLAIVVAFVLFVSGTVGLIVLAASQRADLVSDNYYERELRYQTEIDSAQRAGALGHSATLVYDGKTRCLTVSLPPEHARSGAAGRIQLYRPASAVRDQEFILAPDIHGLQRVPLTNLLPGLWKVRVTWTAQNQEYLLIQRITNSVTAPASQNQPRIPRGGTDEHG